MSANGPMPYHQLLHDFKNSPNSKLSDMLTHLETLESNADRIRHVHEHMKKCDKLPQQSWMKVEKDNEKAINLRQKGNQLFESGEFKLALEAYNESLCFAVKPTTIALAYVKRSIIYLKTGFYNFCRQNISLAMKYDFTKEFYKQLKPIKASLRDINQDTSHIHMASALPKLSHPPNPQNPCIIDELQYNENGQMISNVDLKPGDVVTMEKPLIKQVLLKGAYINCYNCGNDNFLNLRPCPKSTMVMFCSKTCEVEAWKGVYKYECPIIDGLHRTFDKDVLVAIRLTLKALTLFDDVNEFKEFIESIEPEVNLLQFNYRNATERDKFRALLSFDAYKDTNYKQGVILEFIGKTAVAWHILKEFTDMKEIFKARDHEDLFLNVLHKLLQYSKANLHDFGPTYESFHMEDLVDDEIICIKNYTQSTVSVMSNVSERSCAPNLCNIYLPDMILTAVTRPIKAGEPIYFSSLMDHWDNSLMERQEFFNTTFADDCDCEACWKEEDFPTTANVEEKSLVQNFDMFDAVYYHKLYTPPLSSLVFTLKNSIVSALTNADYHYPYKLFPDLVAYLKYWFDLVYLRKPLDCIFIPKVIS